MYAFGNLLRENKQSQRKFGRAQTQKNMPVPQHKKTSLCSPTHAFPLPWFDGLVKQHQFTKKSVQTLLPVIQSKSHYVKTDVHHDRHITSLKVHTSVTQFMHKHKAYSCGVFLSLSDKYMLYCVKMNNHKRKLDTKSQNAKSSGNKI